MTSYAIPRRNYDRLAETVTKLNRRAVRLGVEPLRFEPTGIEWCNFERKQNPLTGNMRVRGWEVVEVDLEGGSIHLPGWAFAGTIEHLGSENVLRTVPGQTIPEHYRDAVRIHSGGR